MWGILNLTNLFELQYINIGMNAGKSGPACSRRSSASDSSSGFMQLAVLDRDLDMIRASAIGGMSDRNSA